MSIALLVVVATAKPFWKNWDRKGKLIAFDQDEDAKRNCAE